METLNIVDDPVGTLHPTATATATNRNLHQRHLSSARGKDRKAGDNIRITQPPRPTKARKSPKQKKARRWARAGRRWKTPLALIALILSLYAINPSQSNIAHPLIFLSYKLESGPDADDGAPPAKYGKGPLDIFFVAFYTLVLFFAREFIMREILRPLALSLGITSRDKQARFNEQVYVAIYTALLAGPLGVYVMYASPTWYFSTEGMYAGYPHAALPAVEKWYYLVQAAFWVQQALVMVLGLERRRRDFRELVLHHVVTVALVALSYRFHFTAMGVLVYVTHDISDFFLAVSFPVFWFCLF